MKKILSVCMLSLWIQGAFFSNLLTASVAPGETDQSQSVFLKAEQAYDAKNYPAAIEGYLSLWKGGTYHEAVAYNLGNAFYRKGERGKAVAAYLAARRVLPRNPEIKANLEFVHAQGQDKLSLEEPSSLWKALCFWKDFLSPRELFYSTLFFLCSTFLLLGVSLWISRLKPLVGLILTLAILLGGLFSLSWGNESKWGAVVVTSARILSGPDAANMTLYELHEGAPFMVTGEQGEWVRVLLSDGKTGWARSQDVLVF
ncbi:MAG: hypothetical protein KA436_04080 [Oligoflexales bacterium]|nr:hypothetical protein [Oligoflexales bacterium]